MFRLIRLTAPWVVVGLASWGAATRVFWNPWFGFAVVVAAIVPAFVLTMQEAYAWASTAPMREVPSDYAWLTYCVLDMPWRGWQAVVLMDEDGDVWDGALCRDAEEVQDWIAESHDTLDEVVRGVIDLAE